MDHSNFYDKKESSISHDELNGVSYPNRQSQYSDSDSDSYAMNKEHEEHHQTMPRGCSIPFMLIICAPKMAINMAWAAQWAAFGPLLQAMLVDSWRVQLLQVIGPLTGLFVAPTIGVLSDRCTSSYGRRRPFLLFGATMTIFCWCFMSYAGEIGVALGDAKNATKTDVPQGDTETRHYWKTVVTVLCYVWMDITVNITQIPASLIIADFVGPRQVTGASIGQGYSFLGQFLVSGYIWFFGAAHLSIHSFFAMLMAVMVLTMLPLCFFANEKQYVATSIYSTTRKYKDAFLAVYTGIRTLPKQLAVYCICFVLMEYGYMAYGGSKGQYFGINVFGGVAEGADSCSKPNAPKCSKEQNLYNHGVAIAGGITDTIFNIVGLIYLIALPYAVKKFGARTVLKLAIIPQALYVVVAFCHVVEVDIAIVALSAITQQTIFALQVPAIIHVIGYGEESNLGLYTGSLNSANVFGQLLNFILSSALVSTPLGYSLPILVGGICSICALIVVHFYFTLHMKTY